MQVCTTFMVRFISHKKQTKTKQDKKTNIPPPLKLGVKPGPLKGDKFCGVEIGTCHWLIDACGLMDVVLQVHATLHLCNFMLFLLINLLIFGFCYMEYAGCSTGEWRQSAQVCTHTQNGKNNSQICQNGRHCLLVYLYFFQSVNLQ